MGKDIKTRKCHSRNKELRPSSRRTTTRLLRCTPRLLRRHQKIIRSLETELPHITSLESTTKLSQMLRSASRLSLIGARDTRERRWLFKLSQIWILPLSSMKRDVRLTQQTLNAGRCLIKQGSRNQQVIANHQVEAK